MDSLNNAICPMCNQNVDNQSLSTCPSDEMSPSSDNRLLIDENLAKNIETSANESKISSKYELEFERIKRIYESPEETIQEFFEPTITHITTACDKKILQIKNIRDDLTQKIFYLIEDNVKQLTTKNSEFESIFNELNKLVEEMRMIEKKLKINNNDTLSNKYECLRSKYAIKINKFYQMVRNNKQIRFFKSSTMVNQNILGLLEEKNSKIINICDYRKTRFISSCSNKRTLKIVKTDKKHFIFTYLGRKYKYPNNEFQFYDLFFDVFYIEVYLKNINIKTKELRIDSDCQNYLISYYGGYIYVYFDHLFHKIFKKINSDLEELEIRTIKKSYTAIYTTKKYVLGFSENDLDIFDHNLDILMTMYTNSNSLIEYPLKISTMHRNRLYLIFQHKNLVTIVNQDSGKMVKSFEIDSECRIFSVSDENVINAYDKSQSCILEINLDGEIDDRIKINGSPNEIEIFFDEDDNYEFIDLENLDLYS